MPLHPAAVEFLSSFGGLKIAGIEFEPEARPCFDLLAAKANRPLSLIGQGYVDEKAFEEYWMDPDGCIYLNNGGNVYLVGNSAEEVTCPQVFEPE